MNRNAINILVQVLCERNFIPRSGIVGHRMGVYLALEAIAEVFSREAMSFCIPGECENSRCFTSSPASGIVS